LNKNKTFAINSTWAKTPPLTLNVILDNQNLTLTESANFLGTHLDTNLSRTLHGKIIEETGCSMQSDEEFILLSGSALTKDSLFCTFSVIVAIWNNSLELHYKPKQGTYKTKEKNESEVGLIQMTSCRQKFKKLQIVTLTRVYILETVMFGVKNPDKYQTHISNHNRDMGQITDFIYNQ